MNVHVPELPHLIVFEVICGFEAWYWSFKTLEPLWTAQYHFYVETCESEQTQPYVYHSIYHVFLIVEAIPIYVEELLLQLTCWVECTT